MAKRQPKSRAGRANTAKKAKSPVRKRKTKVVVFPKEPVPQRPPGPSQGALNVYQRGMEALQQHKHQKALEAFTKVLEEFPEEQALLDRARIYRELCRRALEADLAEPQTAEEKVTAATAALNEDDDGRAELLAKGALRDAPSNDLALYLLATVEIRRGKAESALAYLTDAVAISSEAGSQAAQDAEFASLRDNEAFRKLTRPPASSDRSR